MPIMPSHTQEWTCFVVVRMVKVHSKNTLSTACTFCLLHSVFKTSSIIVHLSLFKHENTIILYQTVSFACGYLYSVMIVLHIGYDGVVCYQIMKYAIRVNSAFCIAVFHICNVCT